MTNDSDSFIQEVDEGLRQDRAMNLLRRYGPWAAGAVIAFILALLGWQVWNSVRINTARTHAEDYAAAQTLARDGNFDDAKAAFETLSGEGPAVYRVMAQMENAALLEQQGDLEAALAGFDAAAEAARDPIMRATAQMRAAYIAADTQDFDALQVRLRPVIESDTRMSYLARELLAIEAWEAGEETMARDTLENLTLAFDAPEAVRQRAQVALSVLGAAPPTEPETETGEAEAPPPAAEGENQ